VYIIYLGITVVVGTLLQVLVLGTPPVSTLLAWFLGVQMGLGAVWAFLGHYFKPDEIAGFIGWPAGNPFQREIAFANLALGLCGILSFLLQASAMRDGLWFATLVVATTFLGGAFSVHVGEIKRSGNTNPGNAGMVFYADILIPLLGWALFLFR